jgi:hypothetical protein
MQHGIESFAVFDTPRKRKRAHDEDDEDYHSTIGIDSEFVTDGEFESHEITATSTNFAAETTTTTVATIALDTLVSLSPSSGNNSTGGRQHPTTVLLKTKVQLPRARVQLFDLLKAKVHAALSLILQFMGEPMLPFPNVSNFCKAISLPPPPLPPPPPPPPSPPPLACTCEVHILNLES